MDMAENINRNSYLDHTPMMTHYQIEWPLSPRNERENRLRMANTFRRISTATARILPGAVREFWTALAPFLLAAGVAFLVMAGYVLLLVWRFGG